MSGPRQLDLPLEGVPARPPVILSASRRTDLPGFYAHRLVDRVRRHVDRLGEPPYGLVLWTRHPLALISEPLRGLLEREVDNVAVNLTVTGLGGTPLEPRVPGSEAVLALLPEVIDLLGGRPERLRWRFDPLLFGLATEELFEGLAGPMGELGVPTVTVSYPATMSLKGPLGAQYEAAGIEPWPGLRAKVAFARALVERARAHGLRVLACCQPKILRGAPGIEPAQCIPLEVLEGSGPACRSFPYTKDRRQRRHCTCPPSVDIGDYERDLCGSGCAYCYSRAGGPRVDWSCARAR